LHRQHIDNLEIKEFKIPEKYRYTFDQEPGEDRNRWGFRVVNV
jgi:hypothetical protein